MLARSVCRHPGPLADQLHLQRGSRQGWLAQILRIVRPCWTSWSLSTRS